MARLAWRRDGEMRYQHIPHPRPGLTVRQKQQLAAFEGKERLSDFDRGTLAALRLFGDETDGARVEKLLRRVEKRRATEKTLKQVNDELKRRQE